MERYPHDILCYAHCLGGFAIAETFNVAQLHYCALSFWKLAEKLVHTPQAFFVLKPLLWRDVGCGKFHLLFSKRDVLVVFFLAPVDCKVPANSQQVGLNRFDVPKFLSPLPRSDECLLNNIFRLRTL